MTGPQIPSIIEATESRREHFGLTVADWAKVLGLRSSHYYEFIRGNRELPKPAMARAYHFGVPAECLFQCLPSAGFIEIDVALGQRMQWTGRE